MIVFDTAEEERVVSVDRIGETEADEEERGGLSEGLARASRHRERGYVRVVATRTPAAPLTTLRY